MSVVLIDLSPADTSRLPVSNQNGLIMGTQPVTMLRSLHSVKQVTRGRRFADGQVIRTGARVVSNGLSIPHARVATVKITKPSLEG